MQLCLPKIPFSGFHQCSIVTLRSKLATISIRQTRRVVEETLELGHRWPAWLGRMGERESSVRLPPAVSARVAENALTAQPLAPSRSSRETSLCTSSSTGNRIRQLRVLNLTGSLPGSRKFIADSYPYLVSPVLGSSAADSRGARRRYPVAPFADQLCPCNCAKNSLTFQLISSRARRKASGFCSDDPLTRSGSGMLQ